MITWRVIGVVLLMIARIHTLAKVVGAIRVADQLSTWHLPKKLRVVAPYAIMHSPQPQAWVGARQQKGVCANHLRSLWCTLDTSAEQVSGGVRISDATGLRMPHPQPYGQSSTDVMAAASTPRLPAAVSVATGGYPKHLS